MMKKVGFFLCFLLSALAAVSVFPADSQALAASGYSSEDAIVYVLYNDGYELTEQYQLLFTQETAAKIAQKTGDFDVFLGQILTFFYRYESLMYNRSGKTGLMRTNLDINGALIMEITFSSQDSVDSYYGGASASLRSMPAANQPEKRSLLREYYNRDKVSMFSAGDTSYDYRTAPVGTAALASPHSPHSYPVMLAHLIKGWSGFDGLLTLFPELFEEGGLAPIGQLLDGFNLYEEHIYTSVYFVTNASEVVSEAGLFYHTWIFDYFDEAKHPDNTMEISYSPFRVDMLYILAIAGCLIFAGVSVFFCYGLPIIKEKRKNNT